jgi:HTH-type transcriptional regulator / antitoxin HigA
MEKEIVMSTVQIENAFAVWPQVEPTLRVPHNDRAYRQLVKLLDQLIDDVGENENHPLASLMEVIGVLIEKYEDENIPELKNASRRNSTAESDKKVIRSIAALAYKQTSSTIFKTKFRNLKKNRVAACR